MKRIVNEVGCITRDPINTRKSESTINVLAVSQSVATFALAPGSLRRRIMGQAGRRPVTTNEGGVLVNVVAKRADNSTKQITAKQLAIYDNGIEQTIRNFTPDPSPARIVLLVDNSLTLRADVEKLEQAAREFAYEIYEGDKLLIVGYDEQAEIVADWTDDAKSIEIVAEAVPKEGPAASLRCGDGCYRSGAAERRRDRSA